jgi:CrcB protein
MSSAPSLWMAAFAVGTGGAVGALCRWQLGVWLSPTGPQPQIATGMLLANWIGAFLMGLLIGWFERMPELSELWRLALITGFLGALTTFSSFSAEVIQMLQQQRYGLALASSALHLLGSLSLTAAGLALLRPGA